MPDALSSLNGIDLVAKKVKLLVVMGGEYPSSSGRPQGCNFCGCAFGDRNISAKTASAAAAYVFSHMPQDVQVLFVGASMGWKVVSGSKLSACTPRQNPCRQAYLDYTGAPGEGRYSWDLLTTLVAIRGVAAAASAIGSECAGGVNQVDAKTGANRWLPGVLSNQSYLELKDPIAARETLDKLLCQPPAIQVV
mmetsp:Transcript_34944/g.61397  ORF Transcript_34944/g.61397 Transcript_34944/m.61397 type:complete len:193 (-) Transcript_34944:54-632(-)